MSRYERRIFFDTLCDLRERYRCRTADDALSVLPLSELAEFVAAAWAVAEEADLREYLETADEQRAASHRPRGERNRRPA